MARLTVLASFGWPVAFSFVGIGMALFLVTSICVLAGFATYHCGASRVDALDGIITKVREESTF